MAGIASLQNENRISKREGAKAQGESFRREQLANLRDDLRRNRRFVLSMALVLQTPENGLVGFGKFYKHVSSQVRKSGVASR